MSSSPGEEVRMCDSEAAVTVVHTMSNKEDEANKPECVKCKSRRSDFWSRVDGGIECTLCQVAEVLKHEAAKQSSTANKLGAQENATLSAGSRLPTRKSTRNTRNTRSRQNPYAYPRPVVPKGKGRRAIFKKTSYKAPTAVSTTVTKDYVFFKGSYIQVGDIVSMRDEDGGLFYAQVRGLLQDQYCEKSAVVTWLLPCTLSPPSEDGFDPSTYTIGMEEDIPRKLECMEFVMHAPSDYFRALNAPYPTVGRHSEAGFVWTSLKPISHISLSS